MSRFEEIAARLGGTLLDHAPLRGGVSARVTAIELAMPDGARQRLVVREPGAAAWKAAAPTTARREFELLGALHRAGLPVPRPLLLELRSPAPLFVMELIEGTTGVPPGGTTLLADLLTRVHSVPQPDEIELPDREDPIAALPELLGERHGALRARLAERSVALTPRRGLLHGDFWPGNALFRDGAIVALLDWEDAALGDPLSDVACCRLELRYVLGAPGATAFTRTYAERTGQSLDELPVWDVYVAAAALASMDQWGLPAERLASMRREAEASLAEAEAALVR